MTSENYQNFIYERSKSQKRPIRPKLLKLTDVSIGHRNRKKTKTKIKERSHSNVRDQIFDDPAYTEDISHLAIPQRRNSGPEKSDIFGSIHKQKSQKDSSFHSKRKGTGPYKPGGSSSSDNVPSDVGNSIKHKRGRSLDRSKIAESSPKKRDKRDRSAKQKRNLSLDNNLATNNIHRLLNSREESANAENDKTNVRIKDTDIHTPVEISDYTKIQIGRRLLKGEIGLKSFNYYLLKEGLKSSKKFVEKQRNSLTGSVNPKKQISRSEENIYEEICFKDEPSLYPNCELCMQECNKENCEYCLDHMNDRQSKLNSLDSIRKLSKNAISQRNVKSSVASGTREAIPTNAHILEFQSYNPSNPGVYKIETTPVAFTSDYNPIHQLHQLDSGNCKEITQRVTKLNNQQPLPPIPIARRSSRITAGPILVTRNNGKSSSSNDSLNHKYNTLCKLDREPYDYNAHNFMHALNESRADIGGSQVLSSFEQPKIYKSDSKVSIISEYSVRSENSNHNVRCGEVSDSSLGDSMFSYSTQRRYFGSSESCRFAFECRRCSFDGEKCSFSDNCRYECKNCDCSSSYFSSDFDELNYGCKNSGTYSHTNQKSKESNTNKMDLKQNKYAQDFFKHVNDVKKSIYQAELQRGGIGIAVPNPYTTIPPPKSIDFRNRQIACQGSREVSPNRLERCRQPFQQQRQQMTYSTLPVSNDVAAIHRKTVFGRISSNQATTKLAEINNQNQNANSNPTMILRKQQFSSLERGCKKSTGAIPKGSSTTSSSSSHYSHRDSENDFLEASRQQVPRIYSQDASKNIAKVIKVAKFEGQSGRNQNATILQENQRKQLTLSEEYYKKKDLLVNNKILPRTKDAPDTEKKLKQLNVNVQPSFEADKKGISTKDTAKNCFLNHSPLQSDELQLDNNDKPQIVIKAFRESFVGSDKLNSEHLNEDDDDVFYDALSEESNLKEKLRYKKVMRTTASIPEILSIEPDDNTAVFRDIKYANNSHSNITEEVNVSTEHTKLQNSTHNNNLVKKTLSTALQQTQEELLSESSGKPEKETMIISSSAEKVNVTKGLPIVEAASLSKSLLSLDSEKTISICNVNIYNDPTTNVEELKRVLATETSFPSINYNGACELTEFSRESDITGVTHKSANSSSSQQNYSILENVGTKFSNNDQEKIADSENEHIGFVAKLDISNLPLPALPPKKRHYQLTKKSSNLKYNTNSIINSSNSFNTTDLKYVNTRRESLENSSRTFQEKLEARNMQIHNLGNSINVSNNRAHKPTYLFGDKCNTASTSASVSPANDKIFLNQSGWVQVNKNQLMDDNFTEHNRALNNQNNSLKNTVRLVQKSNGNEKPVYAVPKLLNNKIEELITRSQARGNNNDLWKYMKPGYKITDPQIASLLNERPGFLPVQTLIDSESTQPVTPILSPPLAFQDTKSKCNESATNDNVQIIKINANSSDLKPVKGMVFSRSFEYDNRRPKDTYIEIFSKSFDSNLLDKPSQRDPSPNFGSLTGCSPNYLTKKEPIRSRDLSPKYPTQSSTSSNLPSQSPRKQELKANPTPKGNRSRKLEKNSHVTDRSGRTRHQQFSRFNQNISCGSSQSQFPNFHKDINQRLNSCDSGARSDLSNDEPDNEYDETNKYLSTKKKSQEFKQLRSLTPEPNDSHSSILRKQRSLTPDSQSFTLRDRRKRNSQVSQNTRQHFTSRNNTLERRQHMGEKSVSASGSTSSSTCSELEISSQIIPHRRGPTRNLKSVEEHRIRRSRSLQLSERSPSRSILQTLQIGEKIEGSTLTPTSNPLHITHQSGIKNNNFPQTIRPNQIISDPQHVGYIRNLKTTENDRSRSFDFDYGSYNNQAASSRLDFDKSRSFDDDYRELCNNKNNNNSNIIMHLKTDPVKTKSVHKISPTSAGGIRQTSPQNYGTRLCDHELTYDMLRRSLDRSPIMDFSREFEMPQAIKKQEAINVGCNKISQPINRNNYSSPSDSSYSIDRLHNSRESLTPNLSNELKSSVVTSDDRLRSDHKYRMQQQQRTLSGHQGSSRGSKIWPQDAKIYEKPRKCDHALEKCQLNEFTLFNDRDFVIENRLKSNIVNMDKKNNSKIEDSPPNETQNIKNIKSFDPTFTKTFNSRKIHFASHSSDKFLHHDHRISRTINFYRRKTTKDQNSDYNQQRSTSLPTVLVKQMGLKSTVERNCNIKIRESSCASVGTNLQSQMRAVSSPCVTDYKNDIIQNKDLTDSNLHTIFNQTNTPSDVLKHVKQTIFNVKLSENSKPLLNLNYGVKRKDSCNLKQRHQSIGSLRNNKMSSKANNAPETDIFHKHRIDPFKWRSNKEYLKTKCNRHDKCNSGDSGIQVELDLDAYGLLEIETENQQSLTKRSNVLIRRANSITSTSVSKLTVTTNDKLLRNMKPIIPTRSLSQPTGLNLFTEIFDGNDSNIINSQDELQIEGRDYPIYAEVLFQFTPAGRQELALEKGSLVEILRKETGPWWFGRIKYEAILETIFKVQQGWFPKDYVRIISTQCKKTRTNLVKKELPRFTLESAVLSTRNNKNDAIIMNEAHSVSSSVNKVRAFEFDSKTLYNTSPSNVLQTSYSIENSAVKELLETELNYVKLLSSLCTGFLPAMRKRIDIFSTESLNLIFSNIESIWQFQQTFLKALRHGIQNDCIAQVFLENKSRFNVYSPYCNSYPRALIELESYSRCKEAKIILENCRLSENLPELPLSANLLVPIQRLCRYPLQLSELIKHTTRQSNTFINEVDCCPLNRHDSKEVLQIALNAMREVTEAVNEGKRHSEHLSRFQNSFENFVGPPLHIHSTRFFMQTDATRVTPNLWNNTYTLFLFDNQLIYCKKDILKRNHYFFKGRIFFDKCRILNLSDGKIFGTSVKNAIRIYCVSQQKWVNFSFRSASRKLRFLSTLAVERQFCGKSLFVSELAGGKDDIFFENDYMNEYDTLIGDENQYNDFNWRENIYDKISETPSKQQNYSDTMPKKSRRFKSENTDKFQYEFNSGSLGRRKIGSWFRKSKSTNSTPNQSPTHNLNVHFFNSDNPTQNIQKFKSNY